MWAWFCPTRTGTPISRLDMRDAVVDTGTQSDETLLRVRFIPIYGGGVSQKTLSFGCPTVFGVTA
jgi:hypothetical protein